MNEEIKLTKREPTWNYILNDLALYSLMTKVIHSECATYQDKFDLMYQIELLQKQNKELKERDLIIAMELEKLQNNWNELKEWLEEQYLRSDDYSDYETAFKMTSTKIQEIEGGVDNE